MSSNMSLKKIKRDLIEAVAQTAQPKTSPYDTDAVVKRVEGDTAYVHITGGVSETPVNLTIDAKKGDKVKVRVSGGSAWIVGNQSAPPTDDARAIVAERKAVAAESKANEAKVESAEAIVQSTEANANASEAVIKANGSVASDTLHYLATSASSGVTINTQGWTTTIQTIDAQKRYLWTYHTYTKANGSTVNTQPVITGTYGVDGTSVTILGSYSTLAELQTAHPTGQLGDAYMVAGDLYVWNGTAWENVGQIQGPKGDTGTSVTAVTNYYLATAANSGVTRQTSGWTTTIQTMTATNQYLWNYEVVKGTGNVTLNTTDPVIIGRYGQNGQNGISVTAVQPQYYLSTSASSATGGSWGTTLVYQSGKYIWTRDAITYSNGNTGYSTAIYNSALTSACVNALNALQIAQDTNQYFWHTSSGTDTGAHITEIPQEDFIDDPSNGGGNLLARSNGIAVRDGLAELATFGADGSRIGKGGQSHMMQDYHSFKMIDRNENTYFAVGDLREQNGKFTQTDTFIGDGSTHQFSPVYYIADSLEDTMVVKVDNVTQVLGTDYDFEYKEIWINTAPANGSIVTLTYECNDAEAKYYTLGTRKAGENVGAMSIVGNKDNTANGMYCVALGNNTVASGNRSVALGYNTIANGADQLVLGAYNETGELYERLQFIIGNGYIDGDTVKRRNALTIDNDGKIVTAQMQSGTINSVSVSANSYKDVSVTFPKQMSAIPTVVCTVYSLSTAGAIGNINAAVTYTTTTGFTCRIFNAGSTAREPAVNWIAMNV